MMMTRVGLSVTIGLLLTATHSLADEAAELKCAAALFSASAGYAKCMGKAITHVLADYRAAKCRSKYQAEWPKLGEKHPGTACDGPRFVDNGNTVTDMLTRLVWEKKTASDGVANLIDAHDADNSYSWSAAAMDADGGAFTAFLADLNGTCFNGHCDWRLPTVFDLQTILLPEPFPCTTDPCTHPLLVPARSDLVAYWTSSTPPHVPDRSYAIHFRGITGALGKTSANHVRAVRAGF